MICITKYYIYCKKNKNVVFLCTNCGNDFSRWQGQCPDCGEWDSLKENRIAAGVKEVSICRISDGDQAVFRWSDLSRVSAYKLDLGSWDQVRVCFETTQAVSFEVSEDDEGFSNLMRTASSALSGFS